MLRPWKLEIQLDYNNQKAIYIQIADAIIEDIHLGRLLPDTALPGSRAMALDLKLNRNTVIEALNVLLNEGWLVSKERKGTFVAGTLPPLPVRLRNVESKQVETPISNRIHINFDDGYPDTKIAPITQLARAYRQIFNRKAKWQMMGYISAYGDPEFRAAIVKMLNYQRGLQVSENQVCITRGSQMAMYLASQCLFFEGCNVIVEDPGYSPAWKTFEHAGAKLLPVNVDSEGMIIDEVKAHLESGKKITALYTTPHHQYPTTVTLSLKRRLELIALSNKYGFTIIEDDYDNEFHFGYRPILPLSSFPELKNYVYMGTMSKVVAPALRIGYLACSDIKLTERIGQLRQIIDVQGDAIMEQAVLQLINDGTIKRHLKKATSYYKQKRDMTEVLLKEHFEGKADYKIPEGGMAFWIVPKQTPNWTKLAEKLEEAGVKIIVPNTYCLDKVPQGFRLSYGSLTAEQLATGIKTIAKLL